MKASFLGLALGAALCVAGVANAQNLCNFNGTATFSPKVTGSPSTGPIAFSFGGTLTGCSKAAYNNATVSSSGTIATGGNCSESTYTVNGVTISGGVHCTSGSFGGVAAGGVTTSDGPQTLNCTDGSHQSTYVLQFLVPPDPSILSNCGPMGSGLSSLSFSGVLGTN